MKRVTGGALVIGEALVDVVNDGSGVVAKHPGGSPANVAVGLARLGRPTTLLTDIGDDRHGDILARHLHRERVELLNPQRRGMRTSSASVQIGADRSATYAFDLTWAPERPARTHRPRLVHTGSLGAVLAPGAAVVVDLLRELTASATVSYDLNIRPAAMGSPVDLWDRVASVVALADIVKASDEDLDHLMPGAPVEEAARRLVDRGPAAVIVTRGAAGSLCVTPTGVVSSPAPRVSVVDTIGAGDSFCAGVIDRLWELGLLGAPTRPLLQAARESDWADVLAYAAAVAAITVSRPGADPPVLAELESHPGLLREPATR